MLSKLEIELLLDAHRAHRVVGLKEREALETALQLSRWLYLRGEARFYCETCERDGVDCFDNGEESQCDIAERESRLWLQGKEVTP